MATNIVVEGSGSSEEVLDLTANKGVPVEEVQDDTPVIEGVSEVVADEQSDTDEAVVADGETSPEVETEGDAEEAEYFVGELQVDISVPDEVSTALTDLGIDADAMIAHLFKKDGDFSLPEADKAKLDEKYGKYLVDTMLKTYKDQNQAVVDGHFADVKSKEEALAANGAQYAEAVGGEEGLIAMETYLLDSLTDDQISVYNKLMESDDHASQLFLISQIKKQMQLEDKIKNGDTDIELVGDKSPNSDSESSPISKGYLTADEYQKEIISPKYNTDKEYAKKVDQSRVAGIRKKV